MLETEKTLTKNEIAFDDIGVADVLLIRTLNSLYRFTVVVPAECYGVLVGGIFGGRPLSALLCGTPALRIGERAHFFVGSGDDYRFMETSTVTDLTHVTTDRRRQHAAHPPSLLNGD